MKNATYFSPDIQNELVNLILNSIAGKIMDLKFLSMMADGVTSRNNEVCAFCLRFIEGITA